MPEQNSARAEAALRESLLGCVLAGLGVGVAWEASHYTLGTTREMGPGYFPLVLGGLLACIGLVLLARSAACARTAPPRAALAALRRSHLWPVALALLGFGLVVEHAGLFLSTAGLVFASSAAGQAFRWRSALLWAVVVAAFCSLLFVTLLGLQLPVWPIPPS